MSRVKMALHCNLSVLVDNRVQQNNYCPQRSCFYTCLSFCSQGGRGICHTHPWADIPWVDTPGQTPPRQTHPPGQTPPAQWMLGYTPLPSACWDTVNKRAVHILLKCILVHKKFRFDPRSLAYLSASLSITLGCVLYLCEAVTESYSRMGDSVKFI